MNQPQLLATDTNDTSAVVCVYIDPSDDDDDNSTSLIGQQIAVASYTNPTGGPATWSRLMAYLKVKIPILIANGINGPDSTVDSSWTDVITRGTASGGAVVASIPSSMTEITIGGLAPGTANAFHVCVVGGSGNVDPASPTASTTTGALPCEHTVTITDALPEAASTVYKANILVPDAFVRLYIWDSVHCDLSTDPGWPTNFVVDNFVCTHYLVEDTQLYRYSGMIPSGPTAAPWAWTSLGAITLDITGYTYTWTLPIGTSTTDTSSSFRRRAIIP
ncbi:hypothetical protein PVAG01_09013 [Phlyctema vagabunda]|uniref:Fibronectin type-III domain-containing protein n=1 Tax=Phlyctema vagabunda TaxID=108571 RepID=A0ABR4P6J6_9HELO